MHNNAYKAFLRSYYGMTALYECVFAYAIYTLLFHVRGLSVFQISLLLATWSILGLMLEIPSGALADSWDRKRMLTVAPLLKGVCFIVWTFAGGDFRMYVLGFLFWEIGSSFVSGTAEAVLYDGLVHFGRTEEYERILGRKHLYQRISVGIACITGGFMAAYHITLPLILSAVPLIGSSVFAALMPHVPKTGSTGEVRYVEYIRIAWREMRTNHTLLYLAAYMLAVTAVPGTLEEFDQLYFELAKLPIVLFGIFGFVGSMFAAWSAANAHKLKDRHSAVYILPAVSAVMLVFVARHPGIPMIGVLMLSYAVTSPINVLMEPRIQRNIGSISRATVTSMINFFSAVTGIFGPLSLGIVSRIWKLEAIYLASAIFLFAVAAWSFLVRGRLVQDFRDKFHVL